MRSFISLVALLACASCASDPITGGQGCIGDFLAGDLVVSEIFANPAGTDDGKEWFEIYNASSTEANLNGVTLLTAKDDGSGEKKHRIVAQTLAAGDYLVVGGVPNTALPAGVDYGYGDDLGDLRNTAGRIQILCGATLVDSVAYATAPEDQSRSFTGAQTPDAVANDDDARWCAATPSPGAANASCTPVGATMCRDGAAMRDIVPPAAGEVKIVEWMPNPSKVDDMFGEWFELRVERDVDLNGVTVTSGADSATLGSVDCLRFAAGSRVLLARGTAGNGGLPAPDFVVDVDLTNSSSGITLSRDGDIIDAVTWTSTGNGVATQIDDAGATCMATGTYGDGDRGTPGVANPSCGGTPGNQCNDGGTMRAIVPPAEGDLAIVEWMANPDVQEDPGGEWFEVLVKKAVDLNGLIVVSGADSATLTDSNCRRFTVGERVLFAHAATMNGGLPTPDFVLSGVGLTNSNSGISLLVGTTPVAAVTWTSSAAGVATQIDDTGKTCPATMTYGDGDKGTPGDDNTACP